MLVCHGGDSMFYSQKEEWNRDGDVGEDVNEDRDEVTQSLTDPV